MNLGQGGPYLNDIGTVPCHTKCDREPSPVTPCHMLAIRPFVRYNYSGRAVAFI